MKWFQGGIKEAITQAKSTNAIFVVFIEGDDDISKGLANVINNEEISNKLENEFVSIKVDSQSESYKQFSQIYQFVPVPSLFFLSPSGTPLEIIASGEMEVDELKNKIEKIQSDFINNKASPSPTNPIPLANIETSLNVETASSSTSEPMESTVDVTPTTDSNNELSTEDKMERAKQLLEKKKQLKQEEEDKLQRQKELERRETGQEVQKLRRRHEDQEMKQAREEWQKEKAEATAARDKILKQIQQDKAERARKVQAEKNVQEKSFAEKAQIPQMTAGKASNCEFSRLQFRLPDGVARTQQFSATATLGEVRGWVQTEVPMTFPDFALSTSFPRREYTRAEDGQTLQQLSLVPNAVMLILPSSTATKTVTPAEPSNGHFLTRFLWNLLTPLISIFDYLRDMFGFRGGDATRNQAPRQPEPSNSPKAKRPRHDDSIPDEMKPRRRHLPGESRTVRRQGNIHGLSNARDSSDDENNTWNGNSTQQM